MTNPKIIARKKGNIGRKTLAMVVLATPTPINNTEPTGGVHTPIHRLVTIIIPKWIGSMPKETATGRKIGVNINTAGVISINRPTNKRIRLMIIKTTNLLSLSVSKALLIDWGISSLDITQDMAIDVAINNITIAVVSEAFNNMEGTSLILSSL